MIDIGDALAAFVSSGVDRGLYAGSAAAVSIRGTRVVRFAGTPADAEIQAVTATTLFDLASVTKTMVAAAAVRLIEDGRLDPHAPISEYLGRPNPAFDAITAHLLLTHTSGFPAESAVWRQAPIPFGKRRDEVLRCGLLTPPGAVYRYSDVGYVVMGAALESAAGTDLRSLVHTRVLEPLGMKSTDYGPVPADRAAATEDESYAGRGMVRGDVHDELAWYLGGVSGNAGLFSTVDDVLTFAESFLRPSLLTAEGLRLMTTDLLESRQGAPFGQAYGPRIDDPQNMGPLHGFGHPGFTGTLWVVHPREEIAAVLLTNRVHPVRTRSDPGPVRRRFGELLATLAR